MLRVFGVRAPFTRAGVTQLRHGIVPTRYARVITQIRSNSGVTSGSNQTPASVRGTMRPMHATMLRIPAAATEAGKKLLQSYENKLNAPPITNSDRAAADVAPMDQLGRQTWGAGDRDIATTAGEKPVERCFHNVNIQTTRNLTRLTLTKPNGDVITWVTPSVCGFKNSRRSTPYAAETAAQLLVKRMQDLQIDTCVVVLKGVGPHRSRVVEQIGRTGINIVALVDKTRQPHNGCRPPRRRRL
eukprot:Clim_evm36s6 gene=Clim_evmTU36s6